MKLAEWARAYGVHPQTAYRWFREDRMPAPARRVESGTIWVDAAPAGVSGRVVIYGRRGARNRAVRAVTAVGHGEAGAGG
ncbi:MAG: hypothetical protein J2P25_10725 [Nocardiopsaceae bacterium]|nr:hypothetical protein [Nocardiopsaceae bacterium]